MIRDIVTTGYNISCELHRNTTSPHDTVLCIAENDGFSPRVTFILNGVRPVYCLGCKVRWQGDGLDRLEKVVPTNREIQICFALLLTILTFINLARSEFLFFLPGTIAGSVSARRD